MTTKPTTTATEEERQKSKTFLLTKQQILYKSLPSLHPCDTKLPNFRRSLYGVGEHNKKLSFSSSKLRYGPFGFNPRKFRQHLPNEMKLNKIDEVWSCANSLFKWRSRFVLIPWQRDLTTSPLQWVHRKSLSPVSQDRKGRRRVGARNSRNKANMAKLQSCNFRACYSFGNSLI